MNPFEELSNQLEEPDEQAPTLKGAATAISEGLRQHKTKKGVLRPRPVSWAKKVARDHFGWSRIGSKKFDAILEIGYSESLFEKTAQGRLVGSSVPDRVVEQTNKTDIAAKTGSPKSRYIDMAPFYRSGGALGAWKVLTEDDWDGNTYNIITLRICPWLDKPIEVPSWKYGQTLYELFDQKVREDLANGKEKTYCTSCKSQLGVESVYPDSHGRLACNACNDLLHPDLRRGADWVPPSPVPVGIKSPKKETDPSPQNSNNSYMNSNDSNTNSLGQSIRDDKVADLMDAEAAIASAK